LRVISGNRKGHRLKGPKNKKIRPTEDRIKESLFNILGPINPDALVLDLFAGSGSIGIEFLSRGAKKAYFVDISSASISLIKENLQNTKLMEKATVMKRDSIRAIKCFKDKSTRFDYIYIDPPFREDKLIFDALEVIDNTNILADKGIIIIEHWEGLGFEDKYLGYKNIDCRKYGSKSITFFAPNS